MSNHYTYDEALALCDEYQYLTGCALCGEYRSLGKVEVVAVSPAADTKKNAFLEYYKAFNDPKKALNFFNTHEYDVVLISRNDQQQISVRDLRAHLAYQTANRSQFYLD